MTELEAVKAVKRYAKGHGCKFTYQTDGAGNVVSFEWHFNFQDNIILPDEIRWFRHATTVQLFAIFDNDIRQIGEVQNITFLSLFNVHNTTQLPDTLACADTLEYLWIADGNRSGHRTVPHFVRQLKKISELSLFVTNFTLILPDWLAELPNLKTLSLSDSKIKEIPYSLVQMGLPFVIDDSRAKNCINLTGVTLEEGELSLFGQSREVIEAAYGIHREQKTTRECKVIFLGDGAAGKSCLIDRIVNDNFDKDSPVTHGVRITPWKIELDNEPFKLRILDFGGQEIMHSMHRCFLTAHTVYVVVCESRDDAEIDGVAARWLETVRAFAPGCPVILALSKADLNGSVSVNEKDLKRRNDALKLVLRTSASAAVARDDSKYGVNRLITAIQDEIPGCINRYEASADMLTVKRELEDMTEPYITSEAYRTLCERNHLTGDKLQRELLDFFKDLGVAYYYEKEGGELDTRLESVRVLSPAWLTNGIYRLILRTPESGFLSHKSIREALGKTFPGDIDDRTTYSEEETEFILHVMRQFEISHVMTRNGKAVEVIPLKMSKEPPNSADRFPRDRSLHLRWKGEYLPNNLIQRMMIRKFSELDTECVWRTGGRFRKEGGGCTALAEMNADQLDVYVTGEEGVREYMESFRDEMKRLLSLLNLNAAEYICTRINGKEGEISYRAVMRQYNDGEKRLFIEQIEEYAAPEDLLKATYPRYLEEAAAYLRAQRDGFGGRLPPELPPLNVLDEKKKAVEIERTEAETKKTVEETKNLRQERWKPFILGALLMLAVLVLGLALGWRKLVDFLIGYMEKKYLS